MKLKYALLGMGLILIPVFANAQEVTAPFLVNPPAIDGELSDGEWDAAAVVDGEWSAHDSATPASVDTTVRVGYSVDAIYLLYECVDSEVQSTAEGTEFLHGGPDVDGQADSTFTWGGDTDYVSLYIDPANVPDDAPDAGFYSYSIQWEPSITAKDESDSDGNSYNYTELGRFGGAQNRFMPPLEDNSGVLHYWGGGLTWQGENIQIVDGPTSDGYLCEVKIPYQSFIGYWRNYFDQPFDLGENLYEIFMNSDATDPLFSRNANFTTIAIDEDQTTFVPVGTGKVTGMPLPGTVWKVQFCRYSAGELGFVNWVGDTSGFVSRPFGDLIFGTASGTDVAEALMHLND